MRVWDAFRAKLDTAIHKALCALQLPFQRQIEVGELLRCREEIILLLFLFKRASNEPPILNAPRICRVTLPASEGFAVKERYIGRLRECREKQRGEKGECAFHVWGKSQGVVRSFLVQRR